MEKEDVEKGKELTPEESAFRNNAARLIKSLGEENQRLKAVMYGRGHRSKGNRPISSVSNIQGLEGLRPRLGQQFQGGRK